MVKTQAPGLPFWSADSRKDYWALRNVDSIDQQPLRAALRSWGHQVSDEDFPVPQTKASISNLQMLHNRIERGFLCYQSRSVVELRTFCDNRNIKYKRSDSKNALADLLRAADERKKFHKFMLLPAELRLSIYDSYFASLKPGIQSPEPPITKTCRLVRKEALSIFEDSRTFRVGVAICEQTRQTARGNNLINPLPSMSRWSILRHVHVLLECYKLDGTEQLFTWYICLSKDRKSFSIAGPEDGSEAIQTVTSRFVDVFEKLLKRTHLPGILSAEDQDGLGLAVRESWGSEL